MTTSPRGSSQPVVLAPGAVFARDFRVVSELARGGMGTVYVVEQAGTQRRRALKLMHPDLVDDERNRARFEREATVGSRIDSEHVVDVVAAGVDGATGVPWLAMELLDGTDLALHVAERGPMSRADVLEAFRQLCHALDAAHRAGIVHRDLKPENVFLARARRSDARFTVKVLDFGIAKWLQEARAATMASQSIGSPYWMSPEQVDSRGAIGPGADVWPLGLIAFYLLTGKVYWTTAHERDASIAALLAEIVALPIEPASVRAARLGVGHLVPSGFDAWFARCVVREPSARFPSAGDALRGLDGALAAASVHQPAPTMPVHGMSGAVIGAPRDGRTVALGAAGARPTPVVLTPAPPIERRRKGLPIIAIVLVALLAVCGIGGGAVLLKRRTRPTVAGSASPPELPPSPSSPGATPPNMPPPTIATPPPTIAIPPPTVATPPPVITLPPTPPTPPPILFSGSSSPDVIGCIPCDGQARFLAPGQPGVARGLGVNNAGASSKSVPVPRSGSLGRLTVQASSADGGRWTFEIWINGAPGHVVCSLDVGQTTCTNETTVPVSAGDRVTLGIGNPGSPFDRVAGQGRFQVSYSFSLLP